MSTTAQSLYWAEFMMTALAYDEIPVDFPTSSKNDADHLTRFWVLIWSIVLQQYTEAQRLIVSLYADHDDHRAVDRSTYPIGLSPKSDVN